MNTGLDRVPAGPEQQTMAVLGKSASERIARALRSPGRALRLAAGAFGLGAALPAAAQPLDIAIAYIRAPAERPAVLSNLDPVPEDDGPAGARLGLADNATTGRLLGQNFTLAFFETDAAGRLVDAPEPPADLVILDAPAETVLAFADRPENAGRLIFNIRSGATALRDGDCRANLLHTIPSLAMRGDALMQFLVLRRWTRLVLIEGRRPADRAFADALRASAAKFGLKIAAAKPWLSDADLRRSAATELPVFTRDFPRHDVVLVADEADDFDRYLPYNTRAPRPVAGTEGIEPVAWSPVVESWGAAQLQSRFEKSAGRDMRPADYAAWTAMRAIGEAATRSGRADPAALRAYLLSDAFELAGFKGRKLSFRPWNGQLRQPIPLAGPRAVIATAPLPGFLHRLTELDTLGLDAPESACTAFDPN